MSGWLLLTLLALPGCNSDQKENDVLVISGNENWNRKKTASPGTRKKIVNFGVTPIRSRKELKKMLQPLLRYLGEKTGAKFILNIATDYNTLKKNLREKKIDIASFSPAAYAGALMGMRNEIKYIASVVKEIKGINRAFYYGYIIVRKSSPIKNIRDLRRKSFAFVDKGSSSGYVYPQTLFNKIGINSSTFFSDIFFMGQHDKVTDAIASGKVSGGATWDGNYANAIRKHGRIFRIIARTPPIPLDAWAANRSIPDSFIMHLRKILVAIDKNTVTRNGEKVINRKEYPYTGFVVRNNRFYDIVIRTVRRLQKSGH